MKTKSESSNGLGSDEEKKVKEFTYNDVLSFVKQDLHKSLLLFDAIYRDQPTVEAIATYLHGRYMNSKHKAELESQTEIGIK